MASVEQDLVPDEMILSTIFLDSVKLADCNIISKTFDTCTFSIHLKIAHLSGYPNDLLIRLQASSGRLGAVAALQRLGHAQLPDLVPSVLNVGTTTTVDGRPVEYSVTAYCTGTVTLEEVWNRLDPAHRLELVDSVVEAMEKLQKSERKDTSFPGQVGGPELGYFAGIKQFLGGILRAGNLKSPNCTLSEIDGGIALGSAFEDIGCVEFTCSDLDDLQHHVVFCHNDLEPRNILVKKLPSTEGKSLHYELDTALGCSNLSFSWYSLFKDRASRLLPQAECHTKLIKALGIIDESRKRGMTKNVGIRVQAKWMEREELEESSDLRRGWVRKAGAKAPEAFTKDVKERFEREAMRELGYLSIQ